MNYYAVATPFIGLIMQENSKKQGILIQKLLKSLQPIQLYFQHYKSKKMTENELLQLKKRIDDSKQDVAQLKGKKQALLGRLSDEWGCTTIKKAKVVLEDKRKELNDITERINENLSKLEKLLNQNGN